MNQSGGLWTHRGYFRSVSLYCVCSSCGSCSGRSTGSSDGKICDCISCSDRMSRIQGADKQSQHLTETTAVPETYAEDASSETLPDDQDDV